MNGIKKKSLTETYNQVVSVTTTSFPDWIDDEDQDFYQICQQEALEWKTAVRNASLRSMTHDQKEEYLKKHNIKMEMKMEEEEEEITETGVTGTTPDRD